MKDQRIALKVKVKPLAEEARIIRMEERKAKDRQDYGLLCSLQEHRRGIVRTEARLAQLAYRIVTLKGNMPRAEGPRTHTPLDIGRLRTLVNKYGPVYDHRGETYDEFISRDQTQAILYRGMLQSAEDLNKDAVACYLESQSERAELNRLRKERYRARKQAHDNLKKKIMEVARQ